MQSPQRSFLANPRDQPTDGKPSLRGSLGPNSHPFTPQGRFQVALHENTPTVFQRPTSLDRRFLPRLIRLGATWDQKAGPCPMKGFRILETCLEDNLMPSPTCWPPGSSAADEDSGHSFFGWHLQIQTVGGFSLLDRRRAKLHQPA